LKKGGLTNTKLLNGYNLIKRLQSLIMKRFVEYFSSSLLQSSLAIPKLIKQESVSVAQIAP